MTQIVQPLPPESGRPTDQAGMDAPHGIHEIASIRRRVLAAIVDWTIGTIISAALGFLLAISLLFVHVSTNLTGREQIIGGDFAGLIVLCWPVIAGLAGTPIVQLIFAYRMGSRGTTPGHGKLNLAVQRADGGGVGRRRALLRSLAGSPSLLAPYLFIVVIILSPFSFYFVFFASVVAVLLVAIANHVWMLLDDKNRGLHDLMVDTVVIRLRKERSWTDGHRQRGG